MRDPLPDKRPSWMLLTGAALASVLFVALLVAPDADAIAAPTPPEARVRVATDGGAAAGGGPVGAHAAPAAGATGPST